MKLKRLRSETGYVYLPEVSRVIIPAISQYLFCLRISRCLLEFVQDAEEMYESLGFNTPSEMILNGYELNPEEVNLALSWLKIVSPEDVISYQDAVDMGRTLRDRPGNPTGRNQYSDDRNYANGTIPKGHGSNNVQYLTARLKRDNPEILYRHGLFEKYMIQQSAD